MKNKKIFLQKKPSKKTTITVIFIILPDSTIDFDVYKLNFEQPVKCQVAVQCFWLIMISFLSSLPASSIWTGMLDTLLMTMRQTSIGKISEQDSRCFQLRWSQHSKVRSWLVIARGSFPFHIFLNKLWCHHT